MQKLLYRIGEANKIDFYFSILSYKSGRAKEIPSLGEFLALSSGEDAPSSFTPEVEAELERQAQARLKELQDKAEAIRAKKVLNG